MKLFGSRPTTLRGAAVHVNDGKATPEQRLKRAQNRVHNLSGKLDRLQRREASEVVIAATEHAISEWDKRRRLADFELQLERGES